MKLRFGVVFLALLMGGCGRHVSGPRVFRYGADGVLRPPAAKAPVEVRGVRGAAAAAGSGCEASAGPFSLRWRGNAAVLALPGAVDPSLADQTLEDFHGAVFALEARGCLAPGGAGRVLDAFAASLALPPRSVYFARYGVYYNSSSLNVEPGFVLKIVSPLVRPGSGPVVVEAAIPDRPGPIDVKYSSNLEGFETTTYRVEAERPAGVRLRLAAVEQSRGGATSAAAKPSAYHLEVPAEARHFRVLFLRRKSASDRDITLVAAPTLQALDESAGRIQGAADARTACLSEPAGRCHLMPALTALNPELVVKVSGREVTVPVGGTVGHALAAAGAVTGNPRRLPLPAGSVRIRRPWRGQMIGVQADDPERLTALVLLGGEEIDWKPGRAQPQ